MGTSKRFLLLIIGFYHHLTAASPAYKYESTLNLSVALTIMMPFGTPTQWQRVVLDTGSQLTWLQCRSGRQGRPSFLTNHSSSYSPIACHDPSCLTNPAETTDLSLPMSCTHRLCRYDYTFADQTTSSGNLVREKSNLGNSQISPPLVIGCSPKKDTATGADGMLGMNRGSLSFISQVKTTKFSYCVPMLANINSGTFHLGDSPYSKSFRYISLLNTTLESQPMASLDPSAYYVRLVGIKIGGEKLNIAYDRFEVCPGQTMIDSGTQYTYLVEAAYAAVRNKVVSLTSKCNIKQKDPGSEFDMCFDHNSNLSDVMEKIGDVVLEFDDGVEVTIAKETTLHNITDHGVCVAFGRSERLGFTTNVFGFFYQQSHCLEFRGDHVGFGKAS